MKKRRSSKTTIILYLAPAVILFVMFILYPVINTIYLSFNSWKGIYGSPVNFVGLTNYKQVLQNNAFWKSLLNSFFFMVGGFCVLMPLSFGLALIITSKLRGTKFMKTAFFMPVMLSTTAVALMWVYILNPSYGALNELLRALHLDGLAKDWLSTPGLNIWSVVLVNEWMYAGYNMLIFAAGLVSIPGDIYEAAEIDGCTGFKRLRYISIPLSKESFKIFSILCVTGCLKAFDLVWAMTKGGPNHTSEVPASLLYNEAFTYKFFGKSSAIGVLLLILGVTLSILVNRLLRREEE
ncbi:carbohydrate ABC transporter permease [Murimonas intestini]|uniref:Carbohydrate ABC transporter membrane protein 1 (CUT1 family) n=1 Tax=Murimonas intestini TaxID=1337051 RepID=A0AB73SZW5_9FIRM|nr:sugar ABC transporter permease [Murimonas intestini]MCR1842722.1 sugar ABC transporter permease [Murimonas intestini]MCR1867939.1 sugar ABC transporter permease [Murimonas intestini]MCR1885291.1 sugar ABC transporter permease [Murimonas intestini]